ncbi:phospholipase A1-IIdelta-like [Olea europaea var. sylvestris]|uniref:phospholipase A1-IIdelta-like n=1 Tax=Olea europaea var. sylvestris TaxID=158386 RepID=UPI000C1D455D|nr:phospholipase A1-IIdelta-like [Olea europaea var. sylvestris]
MVDSPQTEPTWPELLGRDDWNGLLDPLSLSLRRLILRCGDFCQATYDAFNNDGNSKYAGSSRYGKNSFFNKVMLESASDYQVYSFLYTTAKVNFFQALFLHSLSREAWDRETNWIGYTAVTTDEVSRVRGRREAYVVWCGTSRNYEWLNVLRARPESADPLLRPNSWEKRSPDDSSSSDEDENEPKVMNCWLTIYVSNDPNSSFTKLSAREQILAKINALRDQYKDEDLSIILTGHSLGACLAILSAFAEPGIKYSSFKMALDLFTKAKLLFTFSSNSPSLPFQPAPT